MKYQYFTCDVFTDKQFGGNQLAVFPDAEGLKAEQMQLITREFKYSECTFVFPPEAGNSCKVRIFMPTAEIPFAGHPNVGTAFTLATIGKFGDIDAVTEIVFEEGAGLVPVSIHRQPGKAIWCELEAPEQFSLGETISAQKMASVLSISEKDILTGAHLPQVASVGAPFLFVEVADLEVLGKARINIDQLTAIAEQGIRPEVHLYTHIEGDINIRARMFAPLAGIAEDPATGSANCALAGLLTHCAESPSGEFNWRIAQGVEMGRPSILDARTKKEEGKVLKTFIGGSSVMVCEGIFHVEN